MFNGDTQKGRRYLYKQKNQNTKLHEEKER